MAGSNEQLHLILDISWDRPSFAWLFLSGRDRSSALRLLFLKIRGVISSSLSQTDGAAAEVSRGF
jgi:hypothetical protein